MDGGRSAKIYLKGTRRKEQRQTVTASVPWTGQEDKVRYLRHVVFDAEGLEGFQFSLDHLFFFLSDLGHHAASQKRSVSGNLRRRGQPDGSCSGGRCSGVLGSPRRPIWHAVVAPGVGGDWLRPSHCRTHSLFIDLSQLDKQGGPFGQSLRRDCIY